LESCTQTSSNAIGVAKTNIANTASRSDTSGASGGYSGVNGGGSKVHASSGEGATQGNGGMSSGIGGVDRSDKRRRTAIPNTKIADSLEGPWEPWQASGSYPFAGERDVSFAGTPWTRDISHGEMVRAGYDQTLAIEPCNIRYLFQGANPMADIGGDYNKIPWQLGLLTQTE
jgi:hypothetical protein